MARVDAVNICCGVHAGSQSRTLACMQQAQVAGRMILAHPGLAKAGGRGSKYPTITEFRSILEQQIMSFLEMAARYDIQVDGIKLHGTLYHLVEHSPVHLAAYIDFVSSYCPELKLSALSGGRCLTRARLRGLSAIDEIFFDRAYTAHGTLQSRDAHGSVLELQPALERFQHWQQTQQMRAQCGAYFCQPLKRYASTGILQMH